MTQKAALKKLERMVETIVATNRFYASKLSGARFGSLSEFNDSVPFTTKQELIADQAAHPPYGSNLTFPVDRYTRFSQTSGTTGKPLRWLDTPDSWDWMVEAKRRVFDAAQLTAEDRIYFAFSFGPFLGFWVAYDAALKTGCLCFPGGGVQTPSRARAIVDNEITALCCSPTYAIRLGDAMIAENFPAGKVRSILVGGEPGGCIPAVRKELEKRWPGALVFDHHGMTEIGSVSYPCPERDCVLHIPASDFIAEVVVPNSDAPVNEGETGELVLTNLGRIGSPLIRYKTGDLVRMSSGKCACGTEDVALDGGILGRTDDMVIIRGVNVYPSAVEEIVRACAEVAEYRVEIREERGMPEMRIVLEPTTEKSDRDELMTKTETALTAAFSLRIPVQVVKPGGLPRFETKSKRWIRIASS